VGELLDRIPWSREEHLLDLGCGRGAVLVAAARRVPLGRAVGVDLWRTADQSGNSEAAARANAAAAGVGDRVELATGDLIALPSARGRLRALDEAVRVMRPGGRLIIVDIIHSRAYGERLIEHGFVPDRRSLGWRYWYGGPWMSAQLVSVRLPDG
jgi:arsenite methyltransferase